MFKDHFSSYAQDYQQYRPIYPKELFRYLSELVEDHVLAWDCATGNGQAAILLADYFKQVIATDGSKEQIQYAVKKDNVEYRVATAEDSGLNNHSVDLITVAQALHWFDFIRFYAEVRRVLKKNGVLAAFTYDLFSTNNLALNDLIHQFYYEITAEYWASERKYIDEHYQTIPFPFPEITMPNFKMQCHWTIEQMLKYLYTWSGVKQYEQEQHKNPIDFWLWPRISKINLKLNDKIEMNFPLYFKVGRLI